MSSEKQLKQEIHRLTQQLRRLEETKEAQQHQNKKALLQANTKLDFQTRKAEEYQEKYKSSIQYKNQEQSVKELDEKLRQKQNEIIQLMRLDHQKSQQIQLILQQNQQLKKQNFGLSNDLNQIKEAALNAIVDKDTTISELTQKLEQYQNSENSENINSLKGAILDYQEKYHDLEQKMQNTKNDFINLIESKDEEINQLQQKINILKEKHDDRIARFEQENADYQKHIEQLTAERDHQANFQDKYYNAEEKLRKTEKKFVDFQQRTIDQKNDLIISIQKLQQQNQNAKNLNDQIKQLKKKINHYQNTNSTLKSQLNQYKQKLQKVNLDHNRKINHLQAEKKIISDNLVIKMQQIQRLKAELEEKSHQIEPTLKKQKSSTSLVSPQKTLSDDTSGLIQKLKKQNKDLQQANETLKRKIEEQTRQLQQSRQKLIQARGSQSNTQANKLMVQIQDLTSYLKKVECDMLMKKITHAQDENFWSIKEKKYKQEKQNLDKKYKKQISQLLQRIDRMKRLIPKEKKTDYYQSGFK